MIESDLRLHHQLPMKLTKQIGEGSVMKIIQDTYIQSICLYDVSANFIVLSITVKTSTGGRTLFNFK